MHHPDHETLVNLIRSWYTKSDDSLGQIVEARPYGFCSHRANVPQSGDVHIIEPIVAANVQDMLDDIARYFPSRAVSIFIHDRQVDADLHDALHMSGCQRRNENVYLARVGAAPSIMPVAGLRIEPASQENIRDYQMTKLKAFADSEADPPGPDVEAGLALRQAELGGGVQFFIGRIAGEAAGVISWYPGMDRLLLHLGTRVPFRKHGIAKHLLCHAIVDAYANACRSVMLFTDPRDTPIQLYRRLGFTDEVYWMATYSHQPSRLPTE